MSKTKLSSDEAKKILNFGFEAGAADHIKRQSFGFLASKILKMLPSIRLGLQYFHS